MKKLILVVVVMTAICTACNDLKPGKYRIKGKFVTNPDEMVYLINDLFDRADTIGQCILKDNTFEIKGNVDSVKNVSLVINHERIPVLLEEGIFNVKVNPFSMNQYHFFEEGGKEQMLLNRYWELMDSIELKKDTIIRNYQRALFFRDTILLRQAKVDLENNREMIQKTVDQLIEQYPNSYLAAYLLYIWRNDFGKNPERLESRYGLLGDKAKRYVPAKIVKKSIDNFNRMQVGNIAPDFTLTTTEGESFGLKNLKGKVRIICFWDPGDEVSRVENLNMVRLFREYEDAGLNILSISFDNDIETWSEAIKEDGMLWKHIRDQKRWGSPLVDQYVIKGLPRIIMLDENDRIMALDIHGNELQAKVKELLNK